tara:strand:- start:3836 stop:4039 length:204 start_codon:yes stop_codon:yes gene_type:complete
MSPLSEGKESRFPEKANNGTVHFSKRTRAGWKERALERDAERRNEEGRESQPISNRDSNFHIEEKDG